MNNNNSVNPETGNRIARYDYQGRLVLERAAWIEFLIPAPDGIPDECQRMAFLPKGTVITMKEPGQVGR